MTEGREQDKRPRNGQDPALHSFNLATMSGIFPGTRTQTFQRAQVIRTDEEKPERGWIQVHWHDEPRRCTVFLAMPGTDATATAPLLQLTVPTLATFLEQLAVALQECGWRLLTCGTCHFWHAPLHGSSTTTVPVGRCGWGEEEGQIPPALRSQSVLALRCPHWQERLSPTESSEQDSSRHSREQSNDTAAPEPMRRSGESAAVRFTWWQRMRHFLQRQQRGTARRLAQHSAMAGVDWAALLEERSGVGAGTEPCFVCQGRIANLGALTVATAEDDKQTFSLWRCRSCYTLYLNNWIDRWERLDNLETEESYYRIAPTEALTLLKIIYQEQGSEHPHRRHERSAQRQQLLEFIATRIPLSHQIRQGR